MSIPPLRERKGDVALLARHFLKRFVQETGRKIDDFTPAAIDKMEQYHWPGNVRELRNVVERAVALGKGPMIDAAEIWLSSLELAQLSPGDPNAPYQPMSLDEIEKIHVAPHAAAHRLEQNAGGVHPQDRALDARPQDQVVRTERNRR